MLRSGGALRVPWSDPSPFSDVYIAKRGNLTLAGSSVIGWTPTKGSNAPIAFAHCDYSTPTVNGRTLETIFFNLALGTAYITIDALAALITGTAKPFTFAISGILPSVPSPGVPWYLFGFGRGSSTIPAVAVDGPSGVGAVAIGRRNDANQLKSGAGMTIGTSPFAIAASYDGSARTIVSYFNRTQIDDGNFSTLDFGGGACTLDKFNLGASAGLVVQGFSGMRLRTWAFGAVASSAQFVASACDYLCRDMNF